jgi:hypothetical protein
MIKYLACSTNSHLFLPIPSAITFTNSTVDKPTEFAGIKFPSRTLLFALRGTFFYRPTVLLVAGGPLLSGK